jgi:hypothetical protein
MSVSGHSKGGDTVPSSVDELARQLLAEVRVADRPMLRIADLRLTADGFQLLIDLLKAIPEAPPQIGNVVDEPLYY